MGLYRLKIVQTSKNVKQIHNLLNVNDIRQICPLVSKSMLQAIVKRKKKNDCFNMIICTNGNQWNGDTHTIYLKLGQYYDVFGVSFLEHM